jgi:hypothetical protein
MVPYCNMRMITHVQECHPLLHFYIFSSPAGCFWTEAVAVLVVAAVASTENKASVSASSTMPDGCNLALVAAEEDMLALMWMLLVVLYRIVLLLLLLWCCRVWPKLRQSKLLKGWPEQGTDRGMQTEGRE